MAHVLGRVTIHHDSRNSSLGNVGSRTKFELGSCDNVFDLNASIKEGGIQQAIDVA